MKLEQYIRAEINEKLIPLIKKDKCELCGSKENLEVHHIKPFAEILEESLKDLNIDKRDTTKYTQKELYMITDYILGKHFRYKMITVCKNCHKNIIHKKGVSKIGDGFNNYIKRNKIIKQQVIKYNIRTILIPYIKKIINKKLFKTDQNELKNIFIETGLKSKTMGINTLHKFLKDANLNYNIISKRDGKRKLNNGKKNSNYKKTYWIMIKNI